MISEIQVDQPQNCQNNPSFFIMSSNCLHKELRLITSVSRLNILLPGEIRAAENVDNRNQNVVDISSLFYFNILFSKNWGAQLEMHSDVT